VNVRPPQKAIQLVWRNGEGIKFMGDKLAQLKNYNRAFCIIGDCVMSGVFGFLEEERGSDFDTVEQSLGAISRRCVGGRNTEKGF
jgi:hypothetical protein